MWSRRLLWSCVCIAVVVGASDIILGHRGERLYIKCSYESGYETNSKYFCKGECTFGNKIILVESGSPAEDERFSLTDDTTARVFTVTITDLRTEDEGLYWCAVRRTLTADVYSKVLLRVKPAPQTPLPTETGSLAVGVLVSLIGAVLVIVAVLKKKLTCGLVCCAEGLDLTSRRGEENDYEKGNPTVPPNSHEPRSDYGSAANETVVTNRLNLDQIYTELNASRQSHVYHCLTADSAQGETLYHSISPNY